MDRNEEYVRRRRWSLYEKRAIVREAATSGDVIGTAKLHGIQAQHIYRWRDCLFAPAEPAGFIAVSVIADPPPALPAPVPEADCPSQPNTVEFGLIGLSPRGWLRARRAYAAERYGLTVTSPTYPFDRPRGRASRGTTLGAVQAKSGISERLIFFGYRKIHKVLHRIATT